MYKNIHDIKDMNEYILQCKRELAKSLDASTELLSTLADEKDIEIRRNLSDNPNVDTDTLRKIYSQNEKDIKVIENMSGNKNTPSDLLILLLKDTFNIESEILTQKDILTKIYIETVKYEENFRKIAILSNIARHKNATNQLLELLSLNNIASVGVAENPNTHMITLLKLSRSKDLRVRLYVAKNKKASPYILKKLYLNNTCSFDIVEEIAKNLNTPPEILQLIFDENTDKLIKVALAENSSTPPEILNKLSRSFNRYILREIVDNPSTPSKALRRLFYLTNSKFNKFIASNPNTPKDIMKKLANIKDGEIIRRIVQNPNAPSEVLDKLAKKYGNYIMCQNIASNPNTLPETLRELEKNSCGFVLVNIAKNINTPEDVLMRLIDNEDVDISSNAKNTLEIKKKEN